MNLPLSGRAVHPLFLDWALHQELPTALGENLASTHRRPLAAITTAEVVQHWIQPATANLRGYSYVQVRGGLQWRCTGYSLLQPTYRATAMCR